jgi:hypothetical protein
MNKNKVYKTKENIEFEVMPMNWAKRRVETKIPPTITSLMLLDFKFSKSHNCKIEVAYSDGREVVLDALVHYSCSYKYKQDKKGLEEFNGRWNVQGLDSLGNNVLLKILSSNPNI